MTTGPVPQLSKTRFSAGLQCLKRLYLDCFNRELADPVGANQQALFDSGNRVGELARRRFPDGRLIKESHFEVSVLTIGMKLELDAMKFYQSCADGAQSEEERQFYAELAEWEQGHYQAFDRELTALKEEYFQANNFIPM